MTSTYHTHLSLLDLVPVREGGSVADALSIARHTAQLAESLGFTRYWVAEHHNMQGIASSATAVLVGHLAGATSRIRVGSGGIMLPNHAPLVVAEAFGTLAELYPGRIDLGLGRAPGTDGLTMRALRRDRVETEDDFPREVSELQRLLAPVVPGQSVVAMPGAGTEVPIWLLGSSLFSARLAAQRGLPYAFASHFAPDALEHALAIYKAQFRPSQQSAKPHAMAGVNVVLADTDAEADYLFSSIQQRFTDMIRGKRGYLKPPIDDIHAYWSADENMHASRMLACSFVGSPDTVRRKLDGFVTSTGVDELMVASAIFEHQARLRSYELLADLRNKTAIVKAA